MGLDIRFTRRKKVICPHCGELAMHTDEDCIDGGGRGWYPFLESIGYYVPFEERTEENNWCGKDMVLTAKQADELYRFIRKHDLYGTVGLPQMITAARYENDDIVVNADW